MYFLLKTSNCYTTGLGMVKEYYGESNYLWILKNIHLINYFY